MLSSYYDTIAIDIIAVAAGCTKWCLYPACSLFCASATMIRITRIADVPLHVTGIRYFRFTASKLFAI